MVLTRAAHWQLRHNLPRKGATDIQYLTLADLPAPVLVTSGLDKMDWISKCKYSFVVLPFQNAHFPLFRFDLKMQNFYCSSRVEKCGSSQQGQERHQNAHREQKTHTVLKITPQMAVYYCQCYFQYLCLSGKKLKNAALLSRDRLDIRMRTKSRSVTENKQTNQHQTN